MRGLAAAALDGRAVTIRSRAGGERIRLGAESSARSLKRLLQEAGIPTWQRDDLPLVWCDDVLAAVPGLGIAAMFRTEAGAPGFELRWHPHSAPQRVMARASPAIVDADQSGERSHRASVHARHAVEARPFATRSPGGFVLRGEVDNGRGCGA